MEYHDVYSLNIYCSPEPVSELLKFNYFVNFQAEIVIRNQSEAISLRQMKLELTSLRIQLQSSPRRSSACPLCHQFSFEESTL